MLGRGHKDGLLWIFGWATLRHKAGQEGLQLQAEQRRPQGLGCNQFRKGAVEAGGRDQQRPGESEGPASHVAKGGRRWDPVK